MKLEKETLEKVAQLPDAEKLQLAMTLLMDISINQTKRAVEYSNLGVQYIIDLQGFEKWDYYQAIAISNEAGRLCFEMNQHLPEMLAETYESFCAAQSERSDNDDFDSLNKVLKERGI